MISSFFTNLWIELALRKNRISTYVYCLLMFAIAFLFVMTAGGFFSSANVVIGSSKAAINGSYKIHSTIEFLSLIGILIAAPIIGQTVCKDYEAKMDQIVFATPTHRIGFYLGRFVGALLLCLLIFSTLGFGHWLASFVPGLQSSLFTKPKLSASSAERASPVRMSS